MNTPWDEHPLNSPFAATPAARSSPDRAAGAMSANAEPSHGVVDANELQKKLEAMIDEVLSSRSSDWLASVDDSRAQYEQLVFPKREEH